MQVIERLTDRRIAVEKAVNSLGEAPSGLRDVFELCRGFERGFATIINVSAVGKSHTTCRLLVLSLQQLYARMYRISYAVCAACSANSLHIYVASASCVVTCPIGAYTGLSLCQQNQGGIFLGQGSSRHGG